MMKWPFMLKRTALDALKQWREELSNAQGRELEVRQQLVSAQAELGSLRGKVDAMRGELQAAKQRTQIPRAEAVSDEALAGLLNVPDEHPVLRGVLEVMARAEDQSVEDYCAAGKSAEFRAEGGVAVRAIRSLRADVLSAVEMARGPRKK